MWYQLKKDVEGMSIIKRMSLMMIQVESEKMLGRSIDIDSVHILEDGPKVLSAGGESVEVDVFLEVGDRPMILSLVVTKNENGMYVHHDSVDDQVRDFGRQYIEKASVKYRKVDDDVLRMMLRGMGYGDMVFGVGEIEEMSINVELKEAWIGFVKAKDRMDELLHVLVNE